MPSNGRFEREGHRRIAAQTHALGQPRVNAADQRSCARASATVPEAKLFRLERVAQSFLASDVPHLEQGVFQAALLVPAWARTCAPARQEIIELLLLAQGGLDPVDG